MTQKRSMEEESGQAQAKVKKKVTLLQVKQLLFFAFELYREKGIPTGEFHFKKEEEA